MHNFTTVCMLKVVGNCCVRKHIYVWCMKCTPVSGIIINQVLIFSYPLQAAFSLCKTIRCSMQHNSFFFLCIDFINFMSFREGNWAEKPISTPNNSRCHFSLSRIRTYDHPHESSKLYHHANKYNSYCIMWSSENSYIIGSSTNEQVYFIDERDDSVFLAVYTFSKFVMIQNAIA